MIGNRSETLRERRNRHVARGIATSTGVVAAEAQGAVLWDVDEKEYLDFAGGIAVVNVGHSHPRIVEAMRAQLERFTHTCFQVAMYESYIHVSERLNRLMPAEGPHKTLLVTTGAEAVENAVKIARVHTGRPAVIAFNGAFHGRTLLGMTLTGRARPYKTGFGPFAPEVYRSPFPYEYRGWSTERALAALDELLEVQVAPEEVAAFIIEPVLGEGGFVPAPKEFLEGLRERADRHGIVFIADEIQTGFGRTGRWFAMEHSGVQPDLITVAKGLAGGMPLSGVVGKADIMDAPGPGGLGGTYAGNPLACAAALAVMDIMEEENLLEQSQRIGLRMAENLHHLARRFPVVGDVRGVGAMQAIELVRDKDGRGPWGELADRTLRLAEQEGLIALKAGMHGNVLRFLPPLVATEEQVDKACEKLAASLERALDEGGKV